MIHSFKVAATLAAYRVVMGITGTGDSVAYPDTNTALPLGVTKDTVKDTTNAIPVAGPGQIAKVYFNDTCTSGQLVGFDSSGRGENFILGAQTTTSFTIASAYVGILVGPSVALTGTIADVYIMPGFARGSI